MAEEENYEGVSSMSEHLGDYYKFITQNKSDFVPLDQEIAHAQAYCSIQQLRFGNRIRFRFESDGSPEGWQVPRLIIQPFLENAIVHGHEDTMKNGWVHVNITVNAAGLTIAIEDNGRGMPPERLAEWGRQLDQQNDRFGDHAVWNVHRRLRLRYGTSSGIEMKTNEHGGLTVRITVVPEGEDKYEQRTAGR
jgi:two-component system sensor histidine kinase YesM